MIKIKNKVTLLNSISSLFLQVITIISTLIIPRLILSYFGSEVNGLVSSLTQFLNYITLLEGGVTGVIVASLYQPLVRGDRNKLSAIIKTIKKFYTNIGLIFLVYAFILALIYPIIFKTEFSYLYIFILTIVLAVKLVIQYMFSLTLKSLLQADKKVYIVSITNSIMLILNMILVYVSVKIYPNIHILKFIEGITFVIQPIIYKKYVNNHYVLDKDAPEDMQLLKNRWNGLAVNMAAFIHNNTDVTILSLFTNFKIVSVYSVYALVTSGFKQIISSIGSGISPTIGHALARGDADEINSKLDIFEYVIFVSAFLLFTVGGLLITPFVLLYTKNVTDTNYNQVVFGIILVLSEFFYIIKYPHLSLAYNANKFKEITIPCYIEAGINIIISLILVPKHGLIGVAIGTLVAMIYRMIFHVRFTNKNIVKRPESIFYKKLLTFGLTTIIGIFIAIYFIPSVKLSITNWLLHGIIYTLLFSILYFINSLIFYKKELIVLKKYLKI